MFLSHKASILPNSYKVLGQYNNRKVLVKSDELTLVSNVCPHQKSLISLTDGSGNRTCPYHSWTFDIKGNPVSSGITKSYCKNTHSLTSEKIFEWNNLLFDTEVKFNIDQSFQDLVLMESRIDIVDADYRLIMDLFLDVDHIPVVHKGVYDLIGINNKDIIWSFYKNGSVQSVPNGAYWIALYPYTMIEWQQGALFVTVATPYDKKSKVHVYKYTNKDSTEQWPLNEQVWETAWAQDKHQAELLTEFAQENLEHQKIHFREFLNGTY